MIVFIRKYTIPDGRDIWMIDNLGNVVDYIECDDYDCIHILTRRMFRPSGCSMPCRWGCPTPRMFVLTWRMFDTVPLTRPGGCSQQGKIPDPADVRLRAVGLDLQSRPIEYKDFQSAKAMN